jgi:amino acid adenylation domain-containing protein
MRPTNPFVEFRREDTEQSISDRFEQQARRYPQRLAVKAKDEKLTYDELNRISNRAAHAVLACCDQEDEPIALLFKQGMRLITASLGALKAGKAYVSVDLSLPRAKGTQILESVQARLLVTDSEHLSLARDLARGRSKVLNLDDADRTFPDENPGLSVSPDHIAYINYTSGSTGEPKGVVWNHRNELFGIRVKTNELHICPEDRVSLVRSNNVGANRDMFLALLNGAALFPFDVHEQGVAHLGDWLLEEEITVYTCVATIFRHSVQSLNCNRIFPSIRLIHIGGEPLSKTDVELYKKHFSDECIFVSRYSLSETQAVSYYFIDKRTEITEERVPVGYPLEGNQLSLLDDDGKEVGLKQVGEIAVTSPYLALGYWHAAALTRSKFLPDSSGGSARTYLTGDLGYRLPDGCLVHVGRKDFQTKIKGHRVEISEVEMALLDIPGIKQAAVVAMQESGNERRLVAYVVQENESPTFTQIRQLVKENLPGYMIPSSFMRLDILPLTASGKLDRQALPPFEESKDRVAKTVMGARTQVEAVVARIWKEVMKIDAVGIHDDFSALGGDSILAAQIVSRVNNVFPFKRPITTLFAAPTVALLAELVSANEIYPGQSDEIANLLMKVDSRSTGEPEDGQLERGKRGDA